MASGSGLMLDFNSSDDRSSHRSSRRTSRITSPVINAEGDIAVEAQLQKALIDFAKVKVLPIYANNMIRALQAIYNSGIQINESDLHRNTVIINRKSKPAFVTYYTENNELSSGCRLLYLEKTDAKGRKFFIKKFIYSKDNKVTKGAANATLIKILAEIYYQKKAFSLLGSTKVKKLVKRRTTPTINFFVPEIFSYGKIIQEDEEEEGYYIKMEYIDQTKYLTLRKITQFGDMSARHLCESIIPVLRNLNNILIAHFIYHNDLLNPDNILINPKTKTMVIIDFGEASGLQGTAGKSFDSIPDCNTLIDELVSSESKKISNKSKKAKGARNKPRKCKTRKCKH